MVDGGAPDDYAMICLGFGSSLWHFELTQDAQTHPATTTAKLVRLDGTEYAPTVDLSDRTGMLVDTSAVAGAIGQCKHVGNTFQVIDVKC